MRKTSAVLLGTLAAAILATATPAMAQSKGSWTLGVGLGVVDPKSDAGDLDGTALGLTPGLATEVDSDVKPTITFEYFFADNWGIEVLAALPFKHEISIKGVGKVGETKQLPPVITVQYHFANSTPFTPFVGLGLNYTKFFDTDTQGALAGTDLDLDDSFGLAAHVGLDYALSKNSAVRVDVRWADIDTDVEVNGYDLGTAEIDPIVYGMSYVMKF